MSNTPTLYPLVSGRYDSASGLYILTECYGYNSSSSESSSNLQILAYRINNDRTVDLVYNSGSVKTGYYQCLSLLRSGNLSGDGYYYQCLPSSTSTSNYAINIGAYRCSNSGLSLLGTLPLFTLPTTGYTYGISFFPMGLYINSNTLLIMCCSIESSTRYLEFKLVKLEDGIPTKILSTVKLKYSDFNALGYSNTTYDVCYGYGYLFKHGDDGVLAYFAIGGLDTCNTYIADLTVSDTQVIFNNIKKVKKYDGEGYSIGFSNQNGKAGEKIAVYVPN
jgi:hypothetical protein